MRRKNLAAALMCTLCLGVTTVAAPAAALASGTEETAAESDTADESTAADDADSDAAADESTAEDADSDAETEDSTAEDADSDAAAEDSTAEDAETEDEASAETETPVLPAHPDYVASDYVKLGEYKGLTVQTTSVEEVTEEDIDEEIKTTLSGYTDLYEDIEDGTVEDGDITNIDYEGKKDGEAFDGGTDEAYELTIGSGSFIDGFEDGLIGVKAGETVDIPLTFPEDYSSEDLAGQDVVFTVTVNSIKRAPAELTDEIVSTISDDEYSAVDEYRESLRAQLQESRETEQESQINSDLYAQIEENFEVTEFPEELRDYGVQVQIYNDTYYATSYGMELADYVEAAYGLTEDEYQEQIKVAAESGLTAELYLTAIAEAEGIEVSDEEYEEALAEYADYYNMESVDELFEQYTDDVRQYVEDNVRLNALEEKVFDFLQENAVIEELTAEEAAALEEEEAAAETTSEDAEVTSEDAEAASEDAETDSEDTESVEDMESAEDTEAAAAEDMEE